MPLIRTTLILLFVIACSPQLMAQAVTETTAEPDNSNKEKLRKLLDESITWFEFVNTDQPTRPLKPVTVLRWTNNARDSLDGLSVIWVAADGTPAAIAAIYPYGEMFCTEFDSLSRQSFSATKRGEPFWSPEKPGLQFHAFDKAPAPAKAKGIRLLQMKQLARQFDATMLGWSKTVNQSEELRLLPRPLYEYEVENPAEVLDGAVFAFTSGTDPELVLVIEAAGENKQYEYMYAFARRTTGGLEARLGDRVVWQADAYPQGGNPAKNHRGSRQPLAPLLEAQE